MQRLFPVLVLCCLAHGVAHAQEPPAVLPPPPDQPAVPGVPAPPPAPAADAPAPDAPAASPPPAPDVPRDGGPEAPAPAGDQPTVMVLPVNVHLPGAQSEGLGAVLTDALTHAMAERKRHPTVSADELRQMLERETVALGTGCDSTCTAEIAGALGARLGVASEVRRLGETLVWSASLVELKDARVLVRANVRGAGAQALVNMAGELAAALHGEPGATLLTGEQARRRLGLEDAAALQAFASYREAHPQWTTTEAFTAFLAQRNLEQPLASLGEAALGGGAVALTVAMLAALGTGLAVALLLNPAVGALLVAASIVLGLGATALGVAGVVLLVVDALNLGSVKVQPSGCCRDDATLQDLEAADGLHRAAAVTFLLHPPVLVGGIFVTLTAVFAGLAASGLVSSALPDVGGSGLAFGAFFIAAVVAGPLAALLVLPALLVSPVVGLLLLLWPNPHAVLDQPARRATPAPGGNP